MQKLHAQFRAFAALAMLSWLVFSFSEVQAQTIRAHNPSCVGPRGIINNFRDTIGTVRNNNIKQWPSIVAIRSRRIGKNKNLRVCTGTLVTPETVLTTLGCFRYLGVSNSPENFEVVWGVNRLNEAAKTNVRNIKQTTLQPSARESGLVLLHLEKAIKAAPMPLSLRADADPNALDEGLAVSAGFSSGRDGRKSQFSETILPLVSPERCRQRAQEQYIGVSQLCAGYETIQRDHCRPTPGAPLIAYDTDGCPYQIGISQQNARCTDSGGYDIFERISFHAGWLSETEPGLSGVLRRRIPDYGSTNIRVPLTNAIIKQLADIIPTDKGALKIQFVSPNGKTMTPKNIREGSVVNFKIFSPIRGNLIIFDINAHGKVTQLFPSVFESDSVINRGRIVLDRDFVVATPFGVSKIIALVVPADFPIQSFIGARSRTVRGFAQESSANVLINLVDQIGNYLAGVLEKRNGFRGWAYQVLEYEIVPLPLHEKPLTNEIVTLMNRRRMRAHDPIFIRIFKHEKELEIWKRSRDGKYGLLKTFEICDQGNKLGPKMKEGDGVSPEGIYYVKWLRKKTDLHLAMDLNYPNKYDRAHNRTGSEIQIAGGCVSIGNYSFEDSDVEEIYSLAREAMTGGQRRIQVHAFPFRMSDKNFRKFSQNTWREFWNNLRTIYNDFEHNSIPPNISVNSRKKLYFIEPS